jgi:hypothetical protein
LLVPIAAPCLAAGLDFRLDHRAAPATEARELTGLQLTLARHVG